MSKRPGRSARRARQERALARLTKEHEALSALKERMTGHDFEKAYGGRWLELNRQLRELQWAVSQPLLPVPPKQARRLVR